MKHLIICFLLSGTWLLAQEEADTTFIEDEDLIIEKEEADTTEMEGGEVSAEGAAYGYKGLAWGAAMDQLEVVSTDTSSEESSLTHRTVIGTLGQDSVTYTYHFSDVGFWKVVIDYLGIESKDGIDGFISNFHRIEKALTEKYGPPMRTSQNEMGTDREYLFSNFPKLSRAYFRSSWSADSSSIELMLEAVVPQSEHDPPVFKEASRSIRLYYYNSNYFSTASGDTTKASEVKPLSDVY
tara:strand:- start:21752 stop:22468 length:717 start_codon:yes stop_codon:yes gene_type:complete